MDEKMDRDERKETEIDTERETVRREREEREAEVGTRERMCILSLMLTTQTVSAKAALPASSFGIPMCYCCGF